MGRCGRLLREFEDCRKLAEEKKVPLQSVLDEALREWGHGAKVQS